MALTKEDLQAIEALFDKKMDEKLESFEAQLGKQMDGKLESFEARLDKKMDEKLEPIKTQLDEVQESLEEVRGATNSLVAWADKVSVITQIKFPV